MDDFWFALKGDVAKRNETQCRKSRRILCFHTFLTRYLEQSWIGSVYENTAERGKWKRNHNNRFEMGNKILEIDGKSL